MTRYVQGIVPHRTIPARYAGFGEDHLPNLVFARAKRGGAREQIEFPDAIKALAVPGSQVRPAAIEVREPRQERGIVMRSDIVQVFQHKKSVDRAADLFERRHDKIGKNATRDPD